MIVGSDNVFAIENYFVKHFKNMGVSVDIFNAQTIFYNFYEKNIVNKILFKCGFFFIYKKIDKAFRKKIELTKPNVIFVFKGMEITPSALKWIKHLGIKKINFNPDNPFIFSGKGSGNKNVTKSIELYDLHFTYNSWVMKEFEMHYKVPAVYLPFGFELDDALYIKCLKEYEIIKVCFVGNPDKHRGSFINDLAKQGIQIDIYGSNWKRFVNHPNIKLYTTITGDDFWKVLRRYRVQLNLMRIHNPHSHNMRSFEVPGVGGIMLAPDTKEHRSFFEVDKEIFLFTDLPSCINNIKYLLNLNKDEADKIRDKARTKSLIAGYTYKCRAKQALQTIKELVDS